MAVSETQSMDGMGETTTYFDTVVFLTMFLSVGRYLETYGKTRTADAITTLEKSGERKIDIEVDEEEN